MQMSPKVMAVGGIALVVGVLFLMNRGASSQNAASSSGSSTDNTGNGPTYSNNGEPFYVSAGETNINYFNTSNVTENKQQYTTNTTNNTTNNSTTNTSNTYTTNNDYTTVAAQPGPSTSPHSTSVNTSPTNTVSTSQSSAAHSSVQGNTTVNHAYDAVGQVGMDVGLAAAGLGDLIPASNQALSKAAYDAQVAQDVASGKGIWVNHKQYASWQAYHAVNG